MIIKSKVQGLSTSGRVNGKKFSFVNGTLETEDKDIIAYVLSAYDIENNVQEEKKEEIITDEVIVEPKKTKKSK
jgi:hypothetical protein